MMKRGPCFGTSRNLKKDVIACYCFSGELLSRVVWGLEVEEVKHKLNLFTFEEASKSSANRSIGNHINFLAGTIADPTSGEKNTLRRVMLVKKRWNPSHTMTRNSV